MLRVLALDDDNHSCMFVTETGARYENSMVFMRDCLAKPHMETYHIRGFCIIDYSKPLSDLEEDVVDDLFYFMEDIGEAPEGITFEAAFNLMWNSGSERWRS